MTIKKKLTDADIKKMSYEKEDGKQDIRWDELAGFGVRIYPSGEKAFVLFYRAWSEEKQQRIQRIKVLGKFGSMTVAIARNLAKNLISEIALDKAGKNQSGHKGKGKDPFEEFEKQERQSILFRELCDQYIERHAKKHKKSWAEDQRRIDKYLLPAFKDRRLTSLKRSDVATLHAAIGDTKPYMANRVLEQLSKMFELARIWGYLPDGVSNPSRDIPQFKEQKRDRWVTPEELPKLAECINKESNVSGRNALWLYLLTGLRRDELLNAKWEDIDWQRKELRLADTKAGRVHYAPLIEPAIALLQEMPKDSGNPYILPGHRTGQHLVNIEKIWRRVREAAGVEDVRLHDLRRTVGSWLAQSGNSLHLIGRVLNHSSQSTTAVYARFGQDHVRTAVESYGQVLLQAAQTTPATEIRREPIKLATTRKPRSKPVSKKKPPTAKAVVS